MIMIMIHTKRHGKYFVEDPANEGIEYTWCRQKSTFSTNIWPSDDCWSVINKWMTVDRAVVYSS